jgi:hypothetical protein
MRVVTEIAAPKKRVVDEAAAKATEEEQCKRDEEALKNNASPMDIDILETSIEFPLTSGILQLVIWSWGFHTLQAQQGGEPKKVQIRKSHW